jgi:hypothetical protein
LGHARNKIKMNDALDWMFEQLWNTPKDKFEWNAILNKARNMQNEHNKQMSENKLNFLKSQITAFHPEWTKQQVEMEAIRIYNEANTIDDDDEGCLYCGS